MTSVTDYVRFLAGDGAPEDEPELPRMSWLTTGGAVAGIVIAALLAWAIVMTVLYAGTQNNGHGNTVRNNICNHVPGSAQIDDSNGCVYSSRAVVEAFEAIQQYTGDWHFCAYWIEADDWSWFTGGNSWSTWGTDAATNPLIAAFDELNATVQHALSRSTTTFAEASNLEIQLRELALLPNLARLHNYHTGTFDYIWKWSNWAPPTCAALHATVLPFFAAEPDYTAKSMLFMNNTLNAIQLMNEYYPLAIDAGLLWFNDSASGTWYLDWADAAPPGTTQPICDAMPNPSDVAACSAIVLQIDAAMANLEDLMVNQWIPACNAGFNYGSTGRSHLPNGVESSYVWTDFFFRPETAEVQREAIARQDHQFYVTLQDLLDVEFPGTTVPQWQVRLNNLNDADVWLCASDFGPIATQTQLMWGNSTKWSQELMGYGSYDVARPVFSVVSVAGASYSTGSYNEQQLLWDTPSRITYGAALNGPQVCFQNYAYSYVNHEGMFGHARAVPLVSFTQCRNDPVQWLFSSITSYYEGLAVYGETTGIYESSMTAVCPRCTMSALVYYGYANVGTMFDFSFFNNLTFTQCIALSLASGGFPTQSQAYRNCYRSMNSLQRCSYVAPADVIRSLRADVEAALGPDFDVFHWNKFIMRAGMLPWDRIEQLTHTYTLWRLGDPAAADAPGYDYLVCQLFGNTWLNNLGAAHLPILDDTIGSNPTKVSGVLAAAAESNADVAAAMERVRDASTMFFTPQ